MARVDRYKSKQVTQKFILDFCETGMDNHTKQIFKAFNENNWDALKDLSMNYEKDCYTIGAIEIVGKLIKLRLLLQDEHICFNIIERTLISILEQSVKVQEFLIKYLQKSDSTIILNNIQYISKLKCMNNSNRQEWYYSNCFIQ